MPLLKPEIKRALEEIRKGSESKGDEEENLQDKMDSAGMSVEMQLERLANLQADGGGSVGVQLQAIKIGLQISGLLKENERNASTIPSIQIIIEDPQSREKINPILIPRPTVKPNEMKPC